MKNLQYVAIEGTIGVGKTSLANLFSEKLGAKLILEAFEDNQGSCKKKPSLK